MLSDEKLAEIIKAAFRDALAPSVLQRLSFETGEDHDGDPAIFIAVPGAEASDDRAILALLDGTSRLRNELRQRGDERLPYLHYVNEEQPQEKVP